MHAITAKEVKHMRDRGEDFLLVNTLPANSFDATKIPGAVNIPETDDDFVARVEQRASGKEKPIVVYCASLQCDSSTKAAQKLEAAGFQDVWEFEAGAEGWQQMMKEKRGAGTAKR
jgi:rhodanese-related sulfurtransferase